MNDKVKIRVYQPGTHQGRRYTPGPEGMELEVSASQAKALRDRGADKRPVVSDGASVAEVPAAQTPIATRPRA